MTSLLLSLTLSACPDPTLVDKTGSGWTEQDKNTIKRAQSVCVTRYKGCLHYFIKVEPRTYRAVCSRLLLT